MRPAATALLFVFASGCQTAPPAAPAVETTQYHIRPTDLPRPYATADVANPPQVVPRPEGAELTLPPGFAIGTWAEGGFERPRSMALAPNGDVFLTDSRAGKVLVLRDRDHDGDADERFTFAEGLSAPFGLAFHRDWLYVGNTDAVVRFRYRTGQTAAEGDPEKLAGLPARGHWTRTVIFDPAGTKMYVAVGSQSNVDVEADPLRAAISEYNPDGSGHRIYASGTRNPVGMAFHPATGKLWAAVQERDRLGDDLPPEFLVEIREGGFYGWPFAYAGPNEDPRRKGERPDLVGKAIVPDVLIQAHSAVLGMLFYDGAMFPPEYRHDAFVALHGSWNRSERTGYKIIHVPFRDGRPAGGYNDFVSGWMLAPDRKEVWGRPVGLLVLHDGSMLISDDGANKIWRVTWRRP
ncbi:MAG TPA: sorbosone dehydrogenase family protein [Thermoanaerobaculia bacterium]|nr:sorbosone dehydrogenase family protein [Thermoanaerobaculia bacterium]